MTGKQRKWILAGLAVVMAAAMLFRLFRPALKAPPVPSGIGCGASCGVERWSVKTLSDPGAGNVDFTPRLTTVAWLVSQPAPLSLPANVRIAPIETQTFVVRARLVGFKEEKDRDFHVVLADLNDSAETMIVEIPSTECSGACASAHVAEFESARAAFVAREGTLAPHFARVAEDQIIVVTGVGFFDYLHGQTGVAPNGIELHPVISIRFE
jgi:hypothetical protein